MLIFWSMKESGQLVFRGEQSNLEKGLQLQELRGR